MEGKFRAVLDEEVKESADGCFLMAKRFAKAGRTGVSRRYREMGARLNDPWRRIRGR